MVTFQIFAGKSVDIENNDENCSLGFRLQENESKFQILLFQEKWLADIKRLSRKQKRLKRPQKRRNNKAIVPSNRKKQPKKLW